MRLVRCVAAEARWARLDPPPQAASVSAQSRIGGAQSGTGGSARDRIEVRGYRRGRAGSPRLRGSSQWPPTGRSSAALGLASAAVTLRRSASLAPLVVAAGGAGHDRQHGPVDVYSHDLPGDLSPVVANDPALVYVPNSQSNTVTEISQKTFKIVRQFPTGALPQHVTPAWNLKTLYVDNDVGNSLTPIDPRTGRPGRPIPVEDPYNLYFTPDGRYAIVVAERLQRLDFRDPDTMRLI